MCVCPSVTKLHHVVVAQGYQDATMSTKDSKKIMYFKMVVQKTIVPHKEGTVDNRAMQ